MPGGAPVPAPAPVSVGAMNLTVRQWTIVSVLAAGFIVAAWLVSSGGGGGGIVESEDFDEVAWCQTANALSTWGGILDGSADGDDAGELPNLRRALDDARTVGPLALRVDFARIADLALLTDNALADGLSLADALAQAQGQTDGDRVAEALGRVDEAIVDCGHEPVG